MVLTSLGKIKSANGLNVYTRLDYLLKVEHSLSDRRRPERVERQEI